MASALLRLTWTFLTRRNAHLSQCTVTVFTEQCTQIRPFHSQQQRQNKRREVHEKRANNLLTYTALASGLCYAVYKWKDDIWEEIKSFSANNYPVVHASQVLPPGNGQNRDKYNFIADVVETCASSVVYIEVKDNKRRDVFASHSTTSGGSGFIINQDGLILTNAHVVLCKPNGTVQVKLYDGSIHIGVIEDIDVYSDLATVRINKTNLPVMKLGNSSNIRPGEFVVAIGCPLSLSNTITCGVVSSVNRQSTEIGLHNIQIGYIQTDAAITFGNSGGPLVNLDGEAIGINQLKVTAGISFAIPIDYAKEFLKMAQARRSKSTKILQNGPRKKYLGMTMQSLMPDILVQIQQDSNYMSMTHGVLIWKVIPGSPADIAGLQSGDIITYANKEPVVCSDNIYKLLEKSGTIHFQVVRGTKTLFINVDPEDIV